MAHLFWCLLPFLAMAGLVIVAVNQKFGGRERRHGSDFDVAYEEETELPLRMIPLAMLNGVDASVQWSAGREGVAVQTVLCFPGTAKITV